MIIEKAYAKINLVLNIIGKREDGFHEVDFVMSNVELHDTVSIKKSEQFNLMCGELDLDPYENLGYKAWDLMRNKYNLKGEISIDIEKNIPVAAGMAGGSSDAAAVIRAINKMYELELDLVTMQEIGSKIGSDVPFCVTNKTSRAQGRGEIITPIKKNIYKCELVIINPGEALSTKEVYENHRIKERNGDIKELIKNIEEPQFLNFIGNDLEKTAKELAPSIIKMEEYIKQKYPNQKIMVSGSGPTIIVFCENNELANEIYLFAKEKYEKVYQTKIRN